MACVLRLCPLTPNLRVLHEGTSGSVPLGLGKGLEQGVVGMLWAWCLVLFQVAQHYLAFWGAAGAVMLWI